MSVDPMALRALILFAGARLAIVLTPGPVNVLLLSYNLKKDV